MTKTHKGILVFTFIASVFKQPDWFYYNFYFNPRWVDEAWWAIPFWPYVFISGVLGVLFVEGCIRFIKKFT
jgi:hypothetical protein